MTSKSIVKRLAHQRPVVKLTPEQFRLQEIAKGDAHRCTTTYCYPVCILKAVQ